MVIGIIGVLASLLMPAFSGAVGRARETVCLSNMRQIGMMMKFYADDHEDGFPPSTVKDPNWRTYSNNPLRDTDFGIGGRDPKPGLAATTWAPAAERPLFDYQGNPDVFRCPSDRGLKAAPKTIQGNSEEATPRLWDYSGCSYGYNSGRLTAPIDPARNPPHTKYTPHFTLVPTPGGGRSWFSRVVGLPGMTTDEIVHPDRYITMHEPAARPIPRVNLQTATPWWTQWHRNRGRKHFKDCLLAPDRFWSSTLFVDGHAKILNFSSSLKTDPYYPFEATSNWMWYQPTENKWITCFCN